MGDAQGRAFDDAGAVAAADVGGTMARIPRMHEDDPNTPAEVRELLQATKGSRGRLVNLYRALANHPAALQAFTALGATVYGRNSSLTRKQAELAYTTTTVVNNCYL